MQVICHGGRSALSSAEQQVVRLLESWTGQYHMAGLYLANVHVPTGAKTRQVDGVLWTPYGLTAIEVKGFTEPQAGTLEIPANGPWRVEGQPAALHTQAEANPAEQCHTAVYALKNALHHADVDPGYITGLVCLVPRHRQLRLGSTRALPGGITAALATHRDLRRWAHKQRDRARQAVWSADDVLAATHALDLHTLAPDRSALVADGLPDVITHSTRPRQHRPSTRRTQQTRSHSTTKLTPPPAPPAAAQPPPKPAPTAAPPRRPPPAPAPAAPPQTAPPPRGQARPARRRQNHPGSVLALLLLVITLGVAVGLLAMSLHT